jgi:hypothetical protein
VLKLWFAGRDGNEAFVADIKFLAAPQNALRKETCDPHGESERIAQGQ